MGAVAKSTNKRAGQRAGRNGAGSGRQCDWEALVAALQAAAESESLTIDVLGIEEAAALMCCSVDTLRRIPSEELPVYRVGRENVYFREEILRFLRGRRVGDVAIDQILDGVVSELDGQIPGMVDSEPVDVRDRSSRRTT